MPVDVNRRRKEIRLPIIQGGEGCGLMGVDPFDGSVHRVIAQIVQDPVRGTEMPGPDEQVHIGHRTGRGARVDGLGQGDAFQDHRGDPCVGDGFQDLSESVDQDDIPRGGTIVGA